MVPRRHHAPRPVVASEVLEPTHSQIVRSDLRTDLARNKALSQASHGARDYFTLVQLIWSVGNGVVGNDLVIDDWCVSGFRAQRTATEDSPPSCHACSCKNSHYWKENKIVGVMSHVKTTSLLGGDILTES